MKKGETILKLATGERFHAAAIQYEEIEGELIELHKIQLYCHLEFPESFYAPDVRLIAPDESNVTCKRCLKKLKLKQEALRKNKD